MSGIYYTWLTFLDALPSVPFFVSGFEQCSYFSSHLTLFQVRHRECQRVLRAVRLDSLCLCVLNTHWHRVLSRRVASMASASCREGRSCAPTWPSALSPGSQGELTCCHFSFPFFV